MNECKIMFIFIIIPTILFSGCNLRLYNPFLSNWNGQEESKIPITDILFFDDFEDGDASDWTGSSYSVQSPGAASTSNSLQISAPSSAKYSLNNLQPGGFSIYMKCSATPGDAIVHIGDIVNYIARIFFNASGELSVAAGGSYNLGIYTADQWYKIEFMNIDWSTRYFDLYLDDILIQAGIAFNGASTSLTEIGAYCYSGSPDLYIDEVLFKK